MCNGNVLHHAASRQTAIKHLRSHAFLAFISAVEALGIIQEGKLAVKYSHIEGNCMCPMTACCYETDSKLQT